MTRTVFVVEFRVRQRNRLQWGAWEPDEGRLYTRKWRAEMAARGVKVASAELVLETRVVPFDRRQRRRR